MPQTLIPLAIVGGGNMARAIVRGGMDAGILDPRRVAVAELDAPKRDVFRSWGVRAVKRPEELVTWLVDSESKVAPGQILLAVKPQSLPDVGAQFTPLLGSVKRTIISILAGTPTQHVQAALTGNNPARAIGVVRVMSNTPAQVRRGTSAVALGAGAQEGDEELAVEIFSAVGRVVRIDETLMDAFTAVAGSGPAYVYYLAEAMVKAAMEVGFDRDTASWIVRWTITGAAALLDATDQPPETLRAAVTSKGGTTAAAAAVLDKSGVKEALTQAIVAARDRGRELASGRQGSPHTEPFSPSEPRP